MSTTLPHGIIQINEGNIARRGRVNTGTGKQRNPYDQLRWYNPGDVRSG